MTILRPLLLMNGHRRNTSPLEVPGVLREETDAGTLWGFSEDGRLVLPDSDWVLSGHKFTPALDLANHAYMIYCLEGEDQLRALAQEDWPPSGGVICPLAWVDSHHDLTPRLLPTYLVWAAPAEINVIGYASYGSIDIWNRNIGPAAPGAHFIDFSPPGLSAVWYQQAYAPHGLYPSEGAYAATLSNYTFWYDPGLGGGSAAGNNPRGTPFPDAVYGIYAEAGASPTFAFLAARLWFLVPDGYSTVYIAFGPASGTLVAAYLNDTPITMGVSPTPFPVTSGTWNLFCPLISWDGNQDTELIGNYAFLF